MKAEVGLLVLLLTIAGCGAQPGGLGSPSATPSPTRTDSPAASPVPTDTPTPELTPTGPTHDGIGARIVDTNVTENFVIATVRFTNVGERRSLGSIAFRFVENDSHALIDTVSLEPGSSATFEVPLRLFDDDPANLTVQARVNGTIVAERPATSAD